MSAALETIKRPFASCSTMQKQSQRVHLAPGLAASKKLNIGGHPASQMTKATETQSRTCPPVSAFKHKNHLSGDESGKPSEKTGRNHVALQVSDVKAQKTENGGCCSFF